LLESYQAASVISELAEWLVIDGPDAQVHAPLKSLRIIVSDLSDAPQESYYRRRAALVGEMRDRRWRQATIRARPPGEILCNLFLVEEPRDVPSALFCRHVRATRHPPPACA